MEDPPPPYPGLEKSGEKGQPVPSAPYMGSSDPGYYPAPGQPPYPVQQTHQQAPYQGLQPGYTVMGPQGPQGPHTSQPGTVVVVAGGGNCPKCHRGTVYTNYLTCCGIFWAIVLFPLGLLCLLCCAEQQCSYCGSTV